jgi:2,3-bisphosphoglycerate-dependent phosphoglycerate mutase
MSRLILIRHGQSQWNLENRFTGFKDVPLTALGEDEARDAGVKLSAANIIPTHVFTSTLERAWRTTELVLEAAKLKLPMVKHDDLRERDYGDLSGLNKTEIAAKYGEDQVHIWRRSYDVPPPGGESLAHVVARVRPYYEKKIAPLLQADKTVAVISHGNTQRALLIILNLNTPENINSAEIPNGIPMLVEFQDGLASASRYL